MKKGRRVGKVEIPEGYLIFLDNCCNLQASSHRRLFDKIEENNTKSASTMGGDYQPRRQGESRHIGFSLYDPDSNLTTCYGILLL